MVHQWDDVVTTRQTCKTLNACTLGGKAAATDTTRAAHTGGYLLTYGVYGPRSTVMWYAPMSGPTHALTLSLGYAGVVYDQDLQPYWCNTPHVQKLTRDAGLCEGFPRCVYCHFAGFCKQYAGCFARYLSQRMLFNCKFCKLSHND